MNHRTLLLVLSFFFLLLAGTPVLAQLDISGEANLRAFLELGQNQLDSGEEITPQQQEQFEKFKRVVEEAGLERVAFVIAGAVDAPEVAVGLAGDTGKLKDALGDPDGPLAELLQRNPEGGPNDYILQMPEEAGAAAAGSALPDSLEVTMTEGEDMLYFSQPGQDGQAILSNGATASILPGSHERIWKLQSAVPENVKTSIMSAIQKAMAAGQASGNPQVGQAMMMMGMAMPIIDDLSLALAGIDTVAFGFVIAPDGEQVFDFAQRRRDPATAATLGTSLTDGSYQPQGIVGVLNSITTAPGVETRHIQQEDTIFSRMKWGAEANEAIGQAVMSSGMLYFQQIMGGAGAAGAAGAAPGLPGN